MLIREGEVIAKIFASAELAANTIQVPVSRKLPVHYVELRLRPGDRILISPGDHVKKGQVIGRRDISLQMEKLDFEQRQARERLAWESAEVKVELATAESQLRHSEIERQLVRKKLAELASRTLFAGESAQLHRSLATQEHEIKKKRQEVARLRRKQDALALEAQMKRSSLARERQELTRRAAILSAFEGTIVRVEQKSANEAVSLFLFYR